MTIKTYANFDSTQLSEHFNAQEFRCKCGQAHDFQVSEELVDKFERLYKNLNCSKIIMTSGFRCVNHDTGERSCGT